MRTEKKDILDTMMENSIKGARPELDFEDWKQTHQNQIRTFETQTKARHASGRTTWKMQWMRIAAAAVLLIAVSLYVIMTTHSPKDTMRKSQINLSSVSEISLLALHVAYDKGGLEAVDKQYKKAYSKLGSRSNGVSIHELFNEM
ncbi:MAG: hypothetical protein JW828_08005 [Sedimentisphaerales bacterium]|nr:hypothetical protein [Sedimentisphaerales bacterium]